MKEATLTAHDVPLSERETSRPDTVTISVVIPISERHDDLHALYLAHAQILSKTGYPYEFIFVLDGPHHTALQTLTALKEEHPEITIITLNRWFGEATALSVGFAQARGSIILTLSAYFQVEPTEVYRLLTAVTENGYDLAIAWRYPRIDSLLNRMQARSFHWLIQMLTGTTYHDISCGLRAMTRQVTDEIALYGDLHRFIPILAYQRGFNIVEMALQQSPLDAKRRVYGFGVYLRRLLDIFAIFFLCKFTKKPLRFFGLLGAGLLGGGVLITGYLGLYRLLGSGAIAGRPLLLLGVLLMVFGVQLFSIGLLGEIIIFTHARHVQDYRIREILE